MWRLYLRRWRFAALALLLGLGVVAAVAVMAEPIAGHHARAQHYSGPVVTGDGVAAGPLPGRRAPRSDSVFAKRGLQLMQQAAAACQAVAYRSVQLVLWRTGSGTSSYFIDLWHQPGEPAVAQDVAVYAGSPGSPAWEPDAEDSDALVITPATLSRMEANYTLEYQGQGAADNRQAAVVDLITPAGAVAARFWVDQQTKLPIRREMYGPDGEVVNDDTFIDLSTGRAQIGAQPAVEPLPAGATLTGTRIGALRRQGWPVPASLGSRLGLVSATRMATVTGPLIDIYYSDGLSGVSVFVQPGELPARLQGWQPRSVDGYAVLARLPSQRTLAWSVNGYVYTVIASAPPQTVRLVVDRLPHQRPPGLLQRVYRGLARIISWVNPFR